MLKNMPPIFVTLEVLKLERLRVVRLRIPLNIWLIFVTLEVSNLERSSSKIFFIFCSLSPEKNIMLLLVFK